MTISFYFKMAIDNIKKNHRLYVPFILSSGGIVAMYYIMASLSQNNTLTNAYAGMYVASFLNMGLGIIAIFSVVFLFYSSSFIVKRRKSELGLYNVLGLEKKHILAINLVQYLICYLLATTLGIIIGIVFEKAMFLMLLNMLEMNVNFGFVISYKAILSAILEYGIIFTLLFVYSAISIIRSKPIEMLKDKMVGEKEPKAKWLLTLIGIITMFMGYYLAFYTKTAMETVLTFFPAVFLVIIGTYLIFTTGSITLLKILKKNKKYYYKTNHFITVSNMMFRMKKNAIGLASICILSTMVLVMISSTTSLWFSLDKMVEESYPMDFMITTTPGDNKEILSVLGDVEEEAKTTFYDIKSYARLEVSSTLDGNKIYFSNDYNDQDALRKQVIIQYITLDDYNKFTNKHETLNDNEVIIHNINTNVNEKNLFLHDNEYKVKEIINQRIDKLPLSNNINSNQLTIVVPSVEDVNKVYDYQKEVYGDYASQVRRITLFDIPEGSNLTKIEDALNQNLDELNLERFRIDVQSQIENEFRGLYGAFLFLGIFLGIVFMIAIVLIIYYKQISEGSEDAQRFAIMKKVGLSNAEIKKVINSQILIVFFAPLIVAIIHLFGSYNLVNLVIQLLSANSVDSFVLTFVLSILVFTIFYIIVYVMTSKTYYKIVSQSN